MERNSGCSDRSMKFSVFHRMQLCLVFEIDVRQIVKYTSETNHC